MTLAFPDFTVQTLAPGVHAAVAKRMTGAVSNAGIIDLGDRTLVFDTFMCLPAARDLQRAAVELTGRPVDYVVNSHPHPDHVHGNVVFRDGVSILAAAAVRDDLLARGEWWLESTRRDVAGGLRMMEQQLAAATDERARGMLQAIMGWNRTVLAGLPAVSDLRYPTLTFERRLALHGSARSVELLTFGGGHSPCDTILWLPVEHIAFTADVVVSGGHMVMEDGDPEQWLGILDEVDRLGAEVIVPGHGQVQTGAATGAVRQYIRDLLALAERAAREGVTPDSAEQVEIPEAYRALPVPQVFVKNMAALLRRR